MSEWISVKDRLPEQHDTMFTRFKGTDKWRDGMFEKTTRNLLVTIETEKKRFVTTGRLNDRTWRTDLNISGYDNVVAWMEFPEPYEESEVQSE